MNIETQPLHISDDRCSFVLDKINEYRHINGLKAYIWNDLCAIQAQQHTANMANETVPFSHNGWADRYKILQGQLACLGKVSSGSENVSFSKPDMNPLDAWKKSSGHNKNVLSNANLCGIGHVQTKIGDKHYYTAIFMKID